LRSAPWSCLMWLLSWRWAISTAWFAGRRRCHSLAGNRLYGDFPTAFFFLVGYTESLLLLGAVGAFYYARQGNWLKAGLMGTICALARLKDSSSCSFGAGILAAASDTWRQQWPKTLPLLLIPLSVAVYALYWQMTFGLQADWTLIILLAHTARRRHTGTSHLAKHKRCGTGVHPINNGVDLPSRSLAWR